MGCTRRLGERNEVGSKQDSPGWPTEGRCFFTIAFPTRPNLDSYYC
jgi:hypothetical protein